MLSSTWSASHTYQQFTPPVIKPGKEFYNQAHFSRALFFLAGNTKNIMHIFELLHLVIIPREKGQPHFWYAEPHNQYKYKLFLAELPGDCHDLQLTHRQPAPFLDHPGCGSHSPSAFGTATAEAGVFVRFPPAPFLLCAWPNSCLPLCPLTRSINGSERKEVTEHLAAAPRGRWAQTPCGNASSAVGRRYGGTGDRDSAGCSLAITDLLMQHGKSLESLGDTQTNQGIYYFSPCLYHPAKKRSKNSPCTNPRVLFTKLTVPTCS